MRLNITTEYLQRAAKIGNRISESRTSMPVLSGLMLRAGEHGLTVEASDLEVSWRERFPATVEEEGVCVVSAKLLKNIANRLPGEDAALATDTTYLNMTSGSANYKLNTLEHEDWPKLDFDARADMVKVGGGILLGMLARTIYAVSREEARYEMCGVRFEVPPNGESLVSGDEPKGTVLRLVAVDGHRLAVVDRVLAGAESLGLDGGVTVPTKGLKELSRLMEEDSPVEIALVEKAVVARAGGAEFIIRLVEGSFPNYRAVIPDSDGTLLVVEREPLMAALDRIVPLTSERYRSIVLEAEDEKLTISAKNPERGLAQDEVALEAMAAEKTRVGLEPRYLVQALGSFSGKTVKLESRGEEEALTLSDSGDKDTLVVIMPMRV